MSQRINITKTSLLPEQAGQEENAKKIAHLLADELAIGKYQREDVDTVIEHFPKEFNINFMTTPRVNDGVNPHNNIIPKLEQAGLEGAVGMAASLTKVRMQAKHSTSPNGITHTHTVTFPSLADAVTFHNAMVSADQNPLVAAEASPPNTAPIEPLYDASFKTSR